MKQLFILFFAMVFSTSVFAQTWNLDLAHSGVNFSVSHMVITDVDGNFGKYTVDAKLNSAGELEGVEAVIQIASINTDNTDRDNHLKAADFFDAETYPEMKFVSKKIVKKGKNVYKVTGDLTIRGITKTVTLDTKFNGKVKDPWGNTKVGYTSTVSINRFDFGLSWSKALEAGSLVVGKEVHITINTQFVEKK